MKKVYLIILSLIISSCAVSRKVRNDKIEIGFLDEHILPADLEFDGTKVGGLSGIDMANGMFYLVSDQASNPRFYSAEIDIDSLKIDSIKINEVIKIQPTQNDVLDLEAIRILPQGGALVSSEGMINNGDNPGIYQISMLGAKQSSFPLPDYFEANGEQKPRNNGVFEGLSLSNDNKSFWVATELPLKKDGAKPKLYPTRSHVRFTKFDLESGKPVQQFAYKLDGISKLPINFFAINGVTEILQFEESKFLVLERAYSAGYGSYGNTVKIFAVDASGATNTLEMPILKKEAYQLARKTLVFDFKEVKNKLSHGIIDNIEGMCFGPDLPNGNKSLILVSDNNFNSFSKQLNQFILLELKFH